MKCTIGRGVILGPLLIPGTLLLIEYKQRHSILQHMSWYTFNKYGTRANQARVYKSYLRWKGWFNKGTKYNKVKLPTFGPYGGTTATLQGAYQIARSYKRIRKQRYTASYRPRRSFYKRNYHRRSTYRKRNQYTGRRRKYIRYSRY